MHKYKIFFALSIIGILLLDDYLAYRYSKKLPAIVQNQPPFNSEIINISDIECIVAGAHSYLIFSRGRFDLFTTQIKIPEDYFFNTCHIVYKNNETKEVLFSVSEKNTIHIKSISTIGR